MAVINIPSPSPEDPWGPVSIPAGFAVVAPSPNVLALRGDFDLDAVPDFFTATDRYNQAGTHLVLDLTELQYLDSAGLAALVLLRHRFDLIGIDCVLRAPTGPVSRILSETGIANVFTVDRQLPLFEAVGYAEHAA